MDIIKTDYKEYLQIRKQCFQFESMASDTLNEEQQTLVCMEKSAKENILLKIDRQQYGANFRSLFRDVNFGDILKQDLFSNNRIISFFAYSMGRHQFSSEAQKIDVKLDVMFRSLQSFSKHVEGYYAYVNRNTLRDAEKTGLLVCAFPCDYHFINSNVGQFGQDWSAINSGPRLPTIHYVNNTVTDHLIMFLRSNQMLPEANDVVYDLFCGAGYFLNGLVRNGVEFNRGIGIDASADMIELANTQKDENANIEFRQVLLETNFDSNTLPEPTGFMFMGAPPSDANVRFLVDVYADMHCKVIIGLKNNELLPTQWDYNQESFDRIIIPFDGEGLLCDGFTSLIYLHKKISQNA